MATGALKGTLTCQQIDDSEDEGGADADEFDDSLGAEEALVEAAADVLPPLAQSLGTTAFMDAWRVCINIGQYIGTLPGVLPACLPAFACMHVSMREPLYVGPEEAGCVSQRGAGLAE